MCALCGVLGGPEHWTDAVARPGVFTRNVDPLQRRRERMHRVAGANRVLELYGLTLADWQGSVVRPVDGDRQDRDRRQSRAISGRRPSGSWAGPAIRSTRR